MPPPLVSSSADIEQNSTNFFYAYAKKYAAAKVAQLQRHRDKQQAERIEKGMSPITAEIPPVSAEVIPIKYLAHALRCHGFAPTDDELAAAQEDSLPSKATYVTCDQFLEICDCIRSIEDDVEDSDVLASFKSAIIMSPRARNRNSGAVVSDTSINIDSQLMNQIEGGGAGGSMSPLHRGDSNKFNNMSCTMDTNTQHLSVTNNNHSNRNNNSNTNTNMAVVGIEGAENVTSEPGSSYASKNNKNHSNINAAPAEASPADGGDDAPHYITRDELRDVLCQMTEEEFAAALAFVDPRNTNQIDVAKVSELLSSGYGSDPCPDAGRSDDAAGASNCSKEPFGTDAANKALATEVVGSGSDGGTAANAANGGDSAPTASAGAAAVPVHPKASKDKASCCCTIQ